MAAIKASNKPLCKVRISCEENLASFSSRQEFRDGIETCTILITTTIDEDVHNTLYRIKKTCPCNVYPLEPHFYIAKLGYAGVHLFFLFLLQNIDCGYLLEPPRRGGSNVPTIYVLSKNKKNIKNFLLKTFNFYNLKKSLYITWACFRKGPYQA